MIIIPFINSARLASSLTFGDLSLLILTILSGVDRSGTAIGQDRAKVVGPAYGCGTCAGLTKACKDWLNLTGFVTNDAGTFGDAGKGAFRFPGLHLWDMGLGRTFSITERLKFQLRGEFFNVFNHVNFDESTAAGNFAKFSIGKGTFGALTTALDPRIGQNRTEDNVLKAMVTESQPAVAGDKNTFV